MGKTLLKPFTILYVFIFVVSILLPLVTLSSEELPYYLTFVKISVNLAATCLILLIPFFLALKTWLQPRNLIEDLYEKASKQLQNRKDVFPDEVYTIEEVLMSAYKEKNYQGYELGVSKLTQIVEDVFPSSGTEEKENEDKNEEAKCKTIKTPRAITYIIGIFERMGILVKDDPKAIERLVQELGNCAVAVRKLDSDDINKPLIDIIEAVMNKVAKQEDQSTFKNLLFILGGVGGDAVERGHAIAAKRILDLLGNISKVTADKQWNKAEKQRIYAIHSIGGKSIEMVDKSLGMENIAQRAVTKLGQTYVGTLVKNRPNISRQAQHLLKQLGEKSLEKGLKAPLKQAVFHRGKSMELLLTELDNQELASRSKSLLVRYGKESKFPKVAVNCIVWLKMTCFKVFNDHEKVAKEMVEGIGTISVEGDKMEHPDVFEAAINSLVFLSKRIHKSKSNLAFSIAAQLWKLGGNAIIPSSKIQVKKGLKILRSEMGEEALKNGFKWANQWSHKPPNLFNFKKWYYKE